MIIEFKTIRQPPYYRTLYTKKPHIYSPLKNYDYGRKNCTNDKLGCYYYNNSERSSRSIKTYFFLIIFLIILYLIYYVN